MVAVEHVSIDPAMRRWIAADGFLGRVGIGDVMEAGAIGRVIASEHSGFAVGDYAYSGFGVQEFARSDGTGVTKLDPSLGPLTAYLGALGIPGLTAYFGLLDVGRPRPARPWSSRPRRAAVGSVAGQIARIKGCRVIGIAGGPVKCRWLVDELGFDAAIDYKAENVADALEASTSSSTTSAARSWTPCWSTWPAGRASCSAAALSQYNADRAADRNYLELLRTRSSMTGFITPGLQRPLSRGGRGARGLAARRTADRARGDPPRRHPGVPGRPVAAVRRREPRQAHPGRWQ